MSPEMLSDIRQTAEAYFLTGEGGRPGHLEEIIEEAIRATDGEYGIAAAVEWAEGYRFPAEMIESDKMCFRAAQLDLTVMVRRRLKRLEPNRLNAKRVEGLRADNPERPLMMELATKGMFVPRPLDFQSNGQETPAPLRASYMKVHEAVNRMLSDTVQRGSAFLLPEEMARENVPDLHLGTAH